MRYDDVWMGRSGWVVGRLLMRQMATITVMWMAVIHFVNMLNCFSVCLLISGFLVLCLTASLIFVGRLPIDGIRMEPFLSSVEII